jgi:two-component system response regulator NreC
MKNNKKISVFVVDDHHLARMGICESLKTAKDILLIGEAENGVDLQEKIQTLRPNILLLDLKMPDFFPGKLAAWVRDNVPETETLVLTSHDRDAYLSRMMNAGANGYLDKNCREDQLIVAIRRAANNELLYTDEQIERSSRWQEIVRAKWESLTNKERQLLHLLCAGKDNKNMTELLDVSINTVETHISHLLKKLEVESRLQAVIWFNQHKPTDYDEL